MSSENIKEYRVEKTDLNQEMTSEINQINSEDVNADGNTQVQNIALGSNRKA